jgi:hypothetical protein
VQPTLIDITTHQQTMGVLATGIDIEHPLRGGDAFVDPAC